MVRIKRSSFLFFSIEDRPVVDAGAFLRGELEVKTTPQILAMALLTGRKDEISLAQFGLIGRVSTRHWTLMSQIASDPDLDGSSCEELVRRGWLLCDADDPDAAKLRRREELLIACGWHPHATLYHFMDREQNVSPVDLAALSKNSSENAQEFVRRHGPPPAAFHRTLEAEPPVDLPVIDGKGPFYKTLMSRRTVRAFDTTRPLALQDLAVLLRYTFGCHGYIDLSAETRLLHKTSASGGSLHPIEAYPLILNVEGVPPGLYHYSTQDHSLEPLKPLDSARGCELAVEVANGQVYAGSAHALILITARFSRNHWKYRRRSRTYGVMLMDAGHLSQTFYLIAAELGLGAFFTGAVNGTRIEEMHDIDSPEEGALGICGCGIRKSDGADLGLEFRPFEPRKTVL